MALPPSQTDSASGGSCSPWPHRLAVLLACATFPLIWVGGLVTTTKAGMAVPDWPTTYGYNMFLYPWQSWIAGPWDLFIEHGHRLLGAGVGLVTLLLAAACWLGRGGRKLRWLSVAAIVAVLFQGVLGGLRVVLDSSLIGQLHGTFGPLFFALTVALATITSARWGQRSSQADEPALRRVRRLAFISAVLAWVQLALGARLRHMPAGGSPQEFQTVVAFHLFMAAVLLAHVVLLIARVARLDSASAAGLKFPAVALGALLLVQLSLGGWTWVEKHGWPAWFANSQVAEGHVIQFGGLRQSLVITAHVATGSLILVNALWTGLRAMRPATAAGRPASPAIAYRRKEVFA